jgi:hypothetical protein
LSEDFNIDFSTEKSKPLINFLKAALDLNISNDQKESTTKYGIDGFFFKIKKVARKELYCWYWKYHRLIFITFYGR